MSDEQTVVSKLLTPALNRAGNATATGVARWVMTATFVAVAAGVWLRPSLFPVYVAAIIGSLALSRTVGYFDDSSDIERKTGVYPETVKEENASLDEEATCVECGDETLNGTEARTYKVVYAMGYELFRRYDVRNVTCATCVDEIEEADADAATDAIDTTPIDTSETTLEQGTVEFFNETGGYGFIGSPAVDEDVFFHVEDVETAEPDEGEDVRFAYTTEEKGLRATDLALVERERQ